MLAIPAGIKSEAVAAYMHEKIGVNFAPGTYVAFAFMSDSDEFCGGAIISNFRPRSRDCDITCVVETSMAFRHKVCAAVFEYIFKQLDCVRCTAVTTKRNVRARKFMEHCGFVLEGNARLAYDGKRDALIYGLLAEDCRFL